MSDSTLIGRPVPRPDAASFINGSGRYLDDIVIPGVGEIFFVRSPYAHARIVGIDSADAEQAPGVQAVVTGQDIESIVAPWTAILTNLGDMKSVPQSAMPTERVRWCGEPVAAIVAESRAQAEDAADRLTIEWEPLPVVADIETAAADDAPLVHPELGTNVAWRLDIDAGEVDAAFARADTVIERRFEVARQTGVTLEPRGMIAQFDAATKQLTLHHGTQVPHIQRAVYATQLGLAENQVRIICPDIGGGFGLKLHVYPDEVATAAISIYLGRPVKFIADRLESFLADIHARGHRVDAKIACSNDGKIEAMVVDDLAGGGAYLIHPRTSVIEPLLVAICTPLAYDIEHYRASARLVYQNKVMTGQYRGVGMPVATLVAEGLVDAVARELGLDKATIRRRNLIPDDGYPRTAASGEYLECLSQVAALDKLLEMMDYAGLLQQQVELREQGIYCGIGLANVVEGTAASPSLYAAGGAPISSRDACTLRLEADGSIACATGLTDQGQGGKTVIAQIVGATLGVELDRILVIMGDTATTPFGGGTWASRGTAIAGEAALRAAETLRDRIIEVASRLHNHAPDRLAIANGEVVDRASNERVMSLADVGRIVHFNTHELPDDLEPELIVTRHYSQREQLLIYANCSLGVSLEVNVNTGLVRLHKVWGVDDCGRVINAKLVAEQMRGGVVQGIGSALYEECLYDDQGQLLNGTMVDYLVPMAGEMPDIEFAHIETPTKATALGAKGCGEAGTIGISAAIMNAINDALEPFGVEVNAQPFTPEKILQALGKLD